MYAASPQLSPRKKTPLSRPASARWPVDPTYSRDSWEPGAPRGSPFRESDPAHLWKPFGTNKVGFEELDTAVFSDRLELIEQARRHFIPTRPRSRFREQEFFAEKHRQRYQALSNTGSQADGGETEASGSHAESTRQDDGGSNRVQDKGASETAVPATILPHKVSIVLRLGGTHPKPVEQRLKGYGEQFFSDVVTTGVSPKGQPKQAPPPAPPADSRGALLRRSIAAVTGSLMCDVTVDSLMNEQTGEQVDPSQGLVATPRSLLVKTMEKESAASQRRAAPPAGAVCDQAGSELVREQGSAAARLTPGHDWRRFSGDPRVLSEEQQQQRDTVGIDPGRPVLYTPARYDILSRLQNLDRSNDAAVEHPEPPFLTTVGVWVPSVAAALAVATQLRESAANGALQQSFHARGLNAKVDLLEIEHAEEPPPTPPSPPPPDPASPEDSDDESVRVAQVPKADLLQRLFSTGRGFRRLLFSSFLQNALEHVPEQRVVHVTEGPYMHSTFLLREPLWAGMSMRLALIALLQPREGKERGSEDEAATGSSCSPNPYDLRAPQDCDPVWPLWILPNAAALARKGLLRESLEVAERELATNVAMDGTEGRGSDENFDTTAAVFERCVY